MVEQVSINADDYSVPDANQLITEDDTPVDNFASTKQQRLLVGSLYSCLQDQTFLADPKNFYLWVLILIIFDMKNGSNFYFDYSHNSFNYTQH